MFPMWATWGNELCCSRNVVYRYHVTLTENGMTDRRPLNPNVNVPKPGGGTQPRSRNQDGQVRDKRSDAGKPKK